MADPVSHNAFNRPANDSPRSGSSKNATPVVWSVIVLGLIALGIWFAFGA